MQVPTHAIDRALEHLLEIVRENQEVEEEFLGSVGEFFGAGPPTGDARETILAARRHIEWFLLERHSPSLFGVPIEREADRWRERAAPEVADCAEALLTSFTGIFQVTEVRKGEGAWLRDLAGFGEYPLVEPEGAAVLQPGDVIAGRLFPIPDALYVASRAAGFFRSPELAAAIERDLAHVRDDGRANVLHVSQLELEHMFWGAGREPIATDPVGDAREFLAAAGLDERDVGSILERLGASPFEAERLIHGRAGDALGEILDELAFETSIDLDRARGVLIQAWAHLTEPRTEEPPPKAEETTDDARAAVEAFVAGRESGGDLDALFANLERDLSLRHEPVAEPDEEDTPIPDFPGVVGAMVDEFLWDVGREQGKEQAENYASLRLLGRYGERLGVFEELDAKELLRFTTFWLHERGELSNAQDARTLLDALEAFCGWVQEAHEIELATTFGPTIETLRESLPRIVEANRWIDGAPETDPGELFEVASDSDGRSRGLRDRAGNDHAASIRSDLVVWLRPGDRLRGRISEEGRARVYRCYPPEAADLVS